MVDVAVQPVRATTGYVDWSGVIAGAVAASAISFVLLTAGASIGLSLLSPQPNQSYGKLAASLAAFWMVVVPIFSLLVGGYIAGRMRIALEGASDDEVAFRDGIQGLLVWAVSIIIGGTLAFLTAASAAQLGTGVGKAAAASTDRSSIVESAVDTMLRPSTPAPPTEAAATPAPGARPATTNTVTRETAASREEMARVITAAVADGKLKADDRQYLALSIAARTGISPADAEKRIDFAYADAVKAVEQARKAAVAAGLATVTALLAGLVAAWYAAQRGGRHRDQNIPAKFRWTPLARRSPPAAD
jgi:hypothetical protein